MLMYSKYDNKQDKTVQHSPPNVTTETTLVEIFLNCDKFQILG